MSDLDFDRDARRLRRRAGRTIQEMNGMSAQLANAIRAARSEVAQIEANERVTPEAKAQDRQAVEERLRESVDEAEQHMRDASAKIEELVDVATRPDDSDSTVALVRESRLARAWQRTERLLEAGEDPTVIAQRAAKSGDRDTVTALREELPAYLRAKGRSAEVRGTMLEIDHATAPLATPIERAAREVRGELEGARRDAVTAISWARRDGVDATEIPGPDGLIHVG